MGPCLRLEAVEVELTWHLPWCKSFGIQLWLWNHLRMMMTLTGKKRCKTLWYDWLYGRSFLHFHCAIRINDSRVLLALNLILFNHMHCFNECITSYSVVDMPLKYGLDWTWTNHSKIGIMHLLSQCMAKSWAVHLVTFISVIVKLQLFWLLVKSGSTMMYGLASCIELQAFASHFLIIIGLYMNYCLLLIRACALVLCTESVSDHQEVWCSDISARLTSEAYGSEVGRQYPSLGLGNSYCFKLKLVGRDGKESNHRFNCGSVLDSAYSPYMHLVYGHGSHAWYLGEI